MYYYKVNKYNIIYIEIVILKYYKLNISIFNKD